MNPFKEIYKSLNEAEEINDQGILDKIDWKELEKLLSTKLEANIEIVPSISKQNYVKWTSQSLIEKIGILKMGISFIVINSFNTSSIEEIVKNNRYWCTISFSFNLIAGGSNGISIGSARYDLNKKNWEINWQ